MRASRGDVSPTQNSECLCVINNHPASANWLLCIFLFFFSLPSFLPILFRFPQTNKLVAGLIWLCVLFVILASLNCKSGEQPSWGANNPPCTSAFIHYAASRVAACCQSGCCSPVSAYHITSTLEHKSQEGRMKLDLSGGCVEMVRSHFSTLKKS